MAALASLNCEGEDPLVGNDDPDLPLVACDQRGTEKLVMGKRFLKGEEIDEGNGQKSTTGDFLVDEKGHSVSLTDEDRPRGDVIV